VSALITASATGAFSMAPESSTASCFRCSGTLSVPAAWLRVMSLEHGVGYPSSLGATHTPLHTGGMGIAGPHVLWRLRPLRSPSTALLWPWTEAEAMLETVVVVALCQDLFEQIQCQAAGRSCAVS
jgi:hypothetical protein